MNLTEFTGVTNEWVKFRCKCRHVRRETVSESNLLTMAWIPCPRTSGTHQAQKDLDKSSQAPHNCLVKGGQGDGSRDTSTDMA